MSKEYFRFIISANNNRECLKGLIKSINDEVNNDAIQKVRLQFEKKKEVTTQKWQLTKIVILKVYFVWWHQERKPFSMGRGWGPWRWFSLGSIHIPDYIFGGTCPYCGVYSCVHFWRPIIYLFCSLLPLKSHGYLKILDSLSNSQDFSALFSFD